MTKPPQFITHDGHKYRLVRPTGRPAKKPKLVRGLEYWLCPCCDKWLTGDEFGNDRNACNGLKSWCRVCVQGMRGDR